MSDVYGQDDLDGASGSQTAATPEFGSGGGLLGLFKVSGRGPGSAYAGSSDLPPGYIYDGNGKLQLTPGFVQSHPKGPFDWGPMAHNIDWGGLIADTINIAGGAAAGAGLGGASVFVPDPWAMRSALAGVLGLGGQAWKAQADANKPHKPSDLDGATDRASDGRP